MAGAIPATTCQFLPTPFANYEANYASAKGSYSDGGLWFLL
jgi:hypothetical protein